MDLKYSRSLNLSSNLLLKQPLVHLNSQQLFIHKIMELQFKTKPSL